MIMFCWVAAVFKNYGELQLECHPFKTQNSWKRISLNRLVPWNKAWIISNVSGTFVTPIYVNTYFIGPVQQCPCGLNMTSFTKIAAFQSVTNIYSRKYPKCANWLVLTMLRIAWFFL